MQAMSSQLCCNGTLFDCSTANDPDLTLYVDDGGRSPTGGRSSINDQIECVAKVILDLFDRPGRRHAFTIRTGAGYRSDTTQKIDAAAARHSDGCRLSRSLQSPHRRVQPLRERRL